MSCKAEGCDREVYSKDLCKKHYMQVLTHGRLTPELERGGEKKKCPAPHCKEKVSRHGWCRKHDRQMTEHGELTPELERKKPDSETCKIEGCGKEHRAKGLCADHWAACNWKLNSEKIKARRRSHEAQRKLQALISFCERIGDAAGMRALRRRTTQVLASLEDISWRTIKRFQGLTVAQLIGRKEPWTG